MPAAKHPSALDLGPVAAAFLLRTTTCEVAELAATGLIDEPSPGRYTISSLRRYDAQRSAVFYELDQVLADDRAVARAVRLLDASLLAELDTITLDSDPTPPTGISRPIVEDDAK